MATILEYLVLQQEYEKKYGPQTVVLIQIGSFFEVYQYNPSLDLTDGQKQYTETIGKAEIVSKILNMVLTSEDKSKPHSISNPNKLGFPILAYEKHRPLLLDNGFTVIRYEQKKKDKNDKHTERFIAGIDSAATVIDHIPSYQATTYVSCIYIDVQSISGKYDEYAILAGFSLVDVSTGKNVVTESHSDLSATHIAIQDLYRFLLAHQPREVLIYIVSSAKDFNFERYKEWLYKHLELHKVTIVNIRNSINPEYLKIAYHEQLLQKIFSSSTAKQTKVEELDLEKMYYGTISYILLLQYCYEHNENIIKKLQKPETTWLDSQHLILTDDVISQLNILPETTKNRKKGEIDSLFSVVNNTSTMIGERYLKNRLSNPLTDVCQVQKYLDMTEELISDRSLLDQIEKRLDVLPDIMKLHRRLHLGLLKPIEFYNLYRAYATVIELYTLIVYSKLEKMKELLFKHSVVEEFNKCMAYLTTVVDFDKLKMCEFFDGRMECETLDMSFLRPGIDTNVDANQQAITTFHAALIQICGHFNTFITNGRSNPIELTFEQRSTIQRRSKRTGEDEADYDRLGFFVTPAKANILKHAQIDQNLCGTLSFVTKSKNNIEITSPVIADHCQKIETSINGLEVYLYQMYMSILQEISKYDFFLPLTEFIAQLDFIKSNAKTAIKNHYYKPTFVTDEKSYVKIDECRHPIIEKIIESEYVKNDIDLNTRYVGLLLYGCNSTGKTSLAKSIGLNVILAQSGCYTAGHVTLSPYRRIITRLRGDDNLFKGKSSFVVEMSELRTILKYADVNSLVLGDELCRGTESVSGTSLTLATLITLTERKASFIFSTHMHQLTQMELPTLLKVSHLSTTYDDINKKLVYTRKLQDGAGASTYGLDVARSLNLDQDFISLANDIRRKMIGLDELLSSKKSRYNSSLYIDQCQLCGLVDDLETHHIRPQKMADADGFIGDIHKNAKFNLMVLCQKCHDRLHLQK